MNANTIKVNNPEIKQQKKILVLDYASKLTNGGPYPFGIEFGVRRGSRYPK